MKIVSFGDYFCIFVENTIVMKRLLLFLAIISYSLQVNATHLMGGEITWRCIKDPTDPNVGQYIFSMKLYRDCDGITLPTSAQFLDVWNHPSISQIPMDFIGSIDISPDCDVSNSGNLALDCQSNPIGAVEEYIYQSQPLDR